MAVATVHTEDLDLVSILKARCEANAAQRDAALRAVAEFLRVYDRQLQRECSTPEQQNALWGMQALLVEAGR